MCISTAPEIAVQLERTRKSLAEGFIGWTKKNEVTEKLMSLGKIVFPIVMTGLLLYSRTIISMLFLGHLGDTELAGASLAIGFANITGYSVLKGLAAGMEPICCQAYGARKWSIIGQTYRKTLCLLLLAAVPITFLWSNMGPILLHLGQDPKIISVANVYILYSIPDLLAQVQFHPLKIFLRTQKINQPLTLSATVAMILHLPINYFLVIYLNLGVMGVALASAWNSLNINMGLLVYLLVSKNALKPWDRSVMTSCSQSWKPLLALAGPSVISVCLEWWWYEVMLLLCGLLNNPQAHVAAMGILIQTTSLLYVFPSSLSSGLTTLIGHELGGGEPAQAKKTTIIGLTIALVWGFLAFGFTLVVRDVWGMLFTKDPHILWLTSVALPILGLCELGNTPQTAACGILMGSARPKVGCWINFGSFYLIGLPVAVTLGFKFGMGFMGLWFGLVAAQGSCLFMMLITLVCTDWVDQATRAGELTQATEDTKNDLESYLLS